MYQAFSRARIEKAWLREARRAPPGRGGGGGVGGTPDHSSSTCRRLGERGFLPRRLLERRLGRGRGAVVAMRSCGHQSVCKNNTSLVLSVMMTFMVIKKLPLYIRKGWCRMERRSCLVRVDEWPKAPLLGKDCMSCARGCSGCGAV